ncbi:MAG: helix-turn-helix domain-containing protein [Gemmatimonadales bacterium]
MTATTTLPSVFSPLAKALLDSFQEGVVVFDVAGRIVYMNAAGRAVLNEAGLDPTGEKDDLLPELAPVGGRLSTLRVSGMELGEAIFLPHREGPTTLAEREKEAIVRSLEAHAWRLAETAKTLGISRTTLWRRLRAYGLHRDGRTKWDQPSTAP